MIRRKRLCVFLFIGFLQNGCGITLQSSQYDFVKGLFEKEAAPPLNWQVAWGDDLQRVFAVNYEGGTIFANESGLRLAFDGWQVTNVTTLTEGLEKTFTIKKLSAATGDLYLSYEVPGRPDRPTDACRSWIRDGATRWFQDCESSLPSQQNYTNEIGLNENGELVYLRFVVSPWSKPIEARFSQVSEVN